MPEVRFDTYYRYEELSRILQEYAEEAPEFVRLGSIGQSYEGRDIWLVTVTNLQTGGAGAQASLLGGWECPHSRPAYVSLSLQANALTREPSFGGLRRSFASCWRRLLPGLSSGPDRCRVLVVEVKG